MNLPQALQARGFKPCNRYDSAAPLEVFVHRAGPRSVVVSAMDGRLQPTTSNWLLRVYVGQWPGPRSAEPVDSLDCECSPVTLLEAVAIVLGQHPT